MILLDTSAVLWVARGHRRARPLETAGARLYLSPASLLELQLLAETGRIRLAATLDDIGADPRWALDNPAAAAWFEQAWPLSWTRDPFDRLIVAHARLRRWRLATADAVLIEHLDRRDVLAL